MAGILAGEGAVNIRPFSAILLSRRREIGKGAEVEADDVGKAIFDPGNSQVSNSHGITFSRREAPELCEWFPLDP
jgi:hypothetical protein